MKHISPSRTQINIQYKKSKIWYDVKYLAEGKLCRHFYTWAALCWLNMHVWTFLHFKSVSLCLSWSDSLIFNTFRLIPRGFSKKNSPHKNLPKTSNTPKDYFTASSYGDFNGYFGVCRTSQCWCLLPFAVSQPSRAALKSTQPSCNRKLAGSLPSTSNKSTDISVCLVCFLCSLQVTVHKSAS